MGENKRLYFGGAGENTDPLWISRYDRAFNQSDLRISISDDESGDRLVVGTTWWSDGQFHPYLVVQSNGRVGIGTETIGNERLAVNGKIRAKEVVVEANSWDTPWPDYVFNKDYKLSSLNKVEDYIQKNGHLPSIPSQQSINKDGAKLGELVKLQMEKIEELTLYVIQQQHKQDALEQKIKNQQRQIAELASAKN